MIKETPLIKLLQQRLTAHQWLNLHQLLSVTPKKLTRLFNGTDSFEFYHIKVLSELLNIQPYDLIKQYDIKNCVTIDEIDSLNTIYELNNKAS